MATRVGGKRSTADELIGAHVSSAGGSPNAPPRAARIGATVAQIFTKTPNQWRERAISAEEATAFKAAVVEAGLRTVVAHDSYLINLASPDRTLRSRSIRSFKAELERAATLGLAAVVSHPGNYIDDRERGMIRNAEAYTRCLRSVPGPMVYLEGTAGTGSALGVTFEELARLRELIGEDVRARVAFCLDTCHLWSAGYDLVDDYDGVWREWDRIVGRGLLRCLHLNDSKTPRGARRDRHELIGEGTLGVEPFRRIMRDERFAAVPKIIETPKGDDDVRMDRKMLRRLRSYRSGPEPRPVTRSRRPSPRPSSAAKARSGSLPRARRARAGGTPS